MQTHYAHYAFVPASTVYFTWTMFFSSVIPVILNVSNSLEFRLHGRPRLGYDPRWKRPTGISAQPVNVMLCLVDVDNSILHLFTWTWLYISYVMWFRSYASWSLPTAYPCQHVDTTCILLYTCTSNINTTFETIWAKAPRRCFSANLFTLGMEDKAIGV